MNGNSFHTFHEVGRIKEPICLVFFETCARLQAACTEPIPIVSYKILMKEMHIGRDRLQRLLDCVGENELYFKVERKYILEVSNIVIGVDWGKRFIYKGRPAYNFHVRRF